MTWGDDRQGDDAVHRPVHKLAAVPFDCRAASSYRDGFRWSWLSLRHVQLGNISCFSLSEHSTFRLVFNANATRKK